MKLDIFIHNQQKLHCLFWHQPEAISMSDKVIVLTKRPATIKNIHNIEFDIKERTPLNCRESPQFSKYFNLMWKELGNHEHK